ncbi:MAG: hypothetical protein U9Q70_05390 [Chloroflexota bacterium]|nr:hypothetical protein [Chloroflexota bacterium]
MLRRILVTAIAILVGVTVLVGAVWPITPLRELRAILLQWAMIVGAFAFLLAFLNLLRANLARLKRKGRGRFPSFLIVLSALGTVILVMGELLWQDGRGIWSQYLVSNFLVPGESALLALTAVTLLLSGLQIFRVRRSLGSLLFLTVALLLLLKTVPAVGLLADLANWVERVLALAGMRGLIIGVALGTLLSGLRTLFITRPYVEE